MAKKMGDKTSGGKAKGVPYGGPSKKVKMNQGKSKPRGKVKNG